MRNPLPRAAILLWISVASGQPPVPPVTLPPCPECVLAGQSAVPFTAPQAIFVTNPKPFVMNGRGVDWEMTARVVSIRPLILERLTADPATMRASSGLCGFTVFPVLDSKLRPLIPQLKF